MDFLTAAYLSLRDRLRSRAWRITGRSDESEDALQEAFYRLWARQYDIGSASQAEALLQTAVRNVSVDQVRRRRETLPLDAAERLPSTPGTGGDREALALVRKIIETNLTPTQKYILERKEYEGIPLEAIAEKLGMQPGAVQMQLPAGSRLVLEDASDALTRRTVLSGGLLQSAFLQTGRTGYLAFQSKPSGSGQYAVILVYMEWDITERQLRQMFGKQ